MILIAGASGMLGTEVCRQLAAMGAPIRALVRPTTAIDRLQRLKEMGAELTYGDLKDRPSLREACTGIQAVVSCVTSVSSRQPGDSIRTVELEGQINLIEAARYARVHRFIPSLFGLRKEQVGITCPLIDAKTAAEHHLIDSSVPYTIIYAGLFMQSWLSPASGFHFHEHRATVLGDGEKPLSWISVTDLARVVAAVLDQTRFENRIIEIASPETAGMRDVIQFSEKESGETFDVKEISEEALMQSYAETTDPVQKSGLALQRAIARGAAIDPTPFLQEVRVPLTGVRDYVHAVYQRSQAFA